MKYEQVTISLHKLFSFISLTELMARNSVEVACFVLFFSSK